MKHFTVLALGGAALLLSASVSPSFAEAGGCLKYGAAGAVAGHLAHHGVLGAMAGCASGMMVRHHAREASREDMERQHQMPSNYGRTGDPRYDSRDDAQSSGTYNNYQ